MTKLYGFLQLRRGLWEHVRNGSLTRTGALVYIYMLTQADTRTGVWKGSAQCTASDLNIPKSTAKYALRGLDGKYIKRFTVPGRHACYPILLHKFLITQGQHVGLMLDALSSADSRALKFFKPDYEQQIVQHVVQQVAPQRIKENREQRRKANTAPSAPPNPRHKLAFDSCHEAYKAHFGMGPTWGGREAKTLQGFLQEHPNIDAKEIARRYGHLLSSTESYHAQKHGSLTHLLLNFDAFADGPILKLARQGATHGKPKINPEQRTRDNLRAAGLLN